MPISNNDASFILLGHRGVRGPLENTIPAFRRALRHADGIELDVRITADGRLVVLHDGEFRAGREKYLVRELTYGELVKLHPLGRLVPTFNRVLKLSPGVLNVDIKEMETLESIIGVLERTGYLERAVISADDPEWVRTIVKECPNCRVGFSITCARNAVMSLKPPEGVYSIHVPLDLAGYIGFNGLISLLRFYRRKRVRTWLWNYRMNELSFVPKLTSLVDAVISDDPARLKRFISFGSIKVEATCHVGKGRSYSSRP
ncbi:glycerophosphodiester phosphodiesterase family protein [Thermococcus sp. 21S9]|uniref:glycerophosphodiester phosphodiesterase family protein n=1 Tax=Thermococcus sp. 21S9 TaxID=1638223 RepID=UPI001439299F|nr:glycerophosphodiester phosphodiesterase family protein [Thermococcus sp. 21S9]NJE54957.1 glycerophosphodiester phosphodiesterase [Thermococcus sp. 21S9]